MNRDIWKIYEPFLEQMLSSSTEMIQIIFHFMQNLYCNALYREEEEIAKNLNTEQIREQLDELVKYTNLVEEMYPFTGRLLHHAYVPEMLENTRYAISTVRRLLDEKEYVRTVIKIERELFPFVRLLQESVYFWGQIRSFWKNKAFYYENEFALHYSNVFLTEKEERRRRLTIFVLAGRNLQQTKRCVEQIIRETNLRALNADLVLVDHDAAEGTLEYFESITAARVIHFERNVGTYLYSMLPTVCQGKFFCVIESDVIVTRHWATLLLQCMESDPKIIAAVPLTPYTRNHQEIRLNPDVRESYIQWAIRHNHHEPRLWEDRSMLIPVITMYRADSVNKIGFADPFFYTVKHWNDDFSLRARQAGYRQIVCKNVTCYCAPSYAEREKSETEELRKEARLLFKRKNDHSVKGRGYAYDAVAVTTMVKHMGTSGEGTFLGIDCGIGDTMLQFRNMLRQNNRPCSLTSITREQNYAKNLEALSDYFLFTEQIAQTMMSRLQPEFFDCIYIAADASEYSDFRDLLVAAKHCLRPNGCLLFVCKNPCYAGISERSRPEDFSAADTAEQTIVQTVDSLAREIFPSVEKVLFERKIPNLATLAQRLCGAVPTAQQLERMRIDRYYFVCRITKGAGRRV